MSRRVAVIGAGVGGAATALALHRIGAEVTIYEAHQHGADHIGAFLTTAPNGLAALQVLGAHEAVLAAGFPTPHFEIYNGAGRRLGRMTSRTSVEGRSQAVTLRRSDLYQAITADVLRAGIPIRYGSRLAEVEESGSDVRARFTDGSSATADILVGADGLRSRVRTVVDPAAPGPRYLGMLGCGGYAQIDPAQFDAAQFDPTPGVFRFVYGRRAFFGYTMPVPGQVWWFANLPHKREPAPAELAELRGSLRDWLLDAFADDRVPAAAMIRATEDLTTLLPMHDMAPLPTWHRGRTVLVGDSAHITSPSSGQGSSLAIEDGVVLAQCLRDLPDHRQAFTRYQDLRWQRVKEIFDAAVRVNNNKAAGPIGRRVRDIVMPLIFTLADPGKAQAAVHDFTIDWERPVESVAA